MADSTSSNTTSGLIPNQVDTPVELRKAFELFRKDRTGCAKTPVLSFQNWLKWGGISIEYYVSKIREQKK